MIYSHTHVYIYIYIYIYIYSVDPTYRHVFLNRVDANQGGCTAASRLRLHPTTTVFSCLLRLERAFPVFSDWRETGVHNVVKAQWISVNIRFYPRVYRPGLGILRAFSYLRFRKFQSRVWTNLDLVGGP